MIIYGSSVSPYVRKVVAFAAEKGLEFKVKGVTLNSQDPGFREASPFAKMPALRDGDYLLADSSAIVAYMDAVKPDPALIPADRGNEGRRSGGTSLPTPSLSARASRSSSIGWWLRAFSARRGTLR